MQIAKIILIDRAVIALYLSTHDKSTIINFIIYETEIRKGAHINQFIFTNYKKSTVTLEGLRMSTYMLKVINDVKSTVMLNTAFTYLHYDVIL